MLMIVSSLLTLFYLDVIVFVIFHCCAIDSKLLTTQYKTSPEGKKAKNAVKIIGSICITFACIGSGGAGLSFC